ncbi:ParA family protein [Candidatus Woesearchaeota archaeon]|nr:ParA family protein [Candidatus Woesearchaeota archaeon]
MAKAIIFPVNNKGGVGKTSILTDIIAALSRGYATGVIDFDLQASMAGTLIRDLSIGNRRLEFYDELEVQKVLLQEGTTLVFSDPMRRLRLEVQPSETNLAVFPVGMLYNNPDCRKKLEGIIQDDFGSVDVIGMDLPPVPDPALIFDYSLKPVVEISGDATLFPIVVATTEHNSLQIGLDQFTGVYDYLLSLGVEEEKINPILMINKVRAEWNNDIKAFSRIEERDIEKLEAFGLMNEYGSKIVEELKREGITYHVAWLPYFPHLDSERADGRFSFYFGTAPKIFHFPEIYDLLDREGYLKNDLTDVEEKLFVAQIHSLSNFLCSKFKPASTTFYSQNLERKNVAEVQSRLIESMKESREKVFTEWAENPNSKNYQAWETNEITAKSWGYKYKHYQIDIPGTAIPVEVMIQAIYNTSEEIYTISGRQHDPDYKERLTKILTEGDTSSLKYAGLHNLSVKFDGEGDSSTWEIEVKLKKESSYEQTINERFPVDKTMDFFLRNLNDALSK